MDIMCYKVGIEHMYRTLSSSYSYLNVALITILLPEFTKQVHATAWHLMFLISKYKLNAVQRIPGIVAFLKIFFGHTYYHLRSLAHTVTVQIQL